ncbi:MAG: hypothetical protein AAF849_17535 [Bacteroidota bacterium]
MNLTSKATSTKRVLLVVVLLSIAAIVWFTKASVGSSTDGNTAYQEIGDAKIAVLPFENKTDDPSFETLGIMAADWIIQGLVYLGNVQIVSHTNIQDHIQYLDQDDLHNEFAARTGAEKIVRGNYYLDGGYIFVESEVIDLRSGKIEWVMPVIKGAIENPDELIGQLQQKFATAFTASGHYFSPGVAQSPPTYGAYQLYQQGTNLYGANFTKSIELFNQAIQKDKRFFMPYLFVTGAHFMNGEKAKADSVFNLIKTHINIDYLPPTQKQWYWHWRAILNKDLPTAFENILLNLEVDPKQLMTNLEAGIMANDLNRPAEAVRIFNFIEPEHVNSSTELSTWWHRHYAHNLYRLGRFKEAESILAYIPKHLRRHWNYYERMAELLIAQAQEERLEQLVQDLLQNSGSLTDHLSTILFIAERYGVQQQTDKQIEWANRGLEWITQQPQTMDINSYFPGTLYYIAGDYQQALPWLQKAIGEDLNWLQISKGEPGWLQLSSLGSCYLALGDLEHAQQTLVRMQEWYERSQDAGYLIAQAHFYAQQGNKDQAVAKIKAAFQKAHPYTPRAYENDFLLLPLKDYPPFESFVRARG